MHKDKINYSNQDNPLLQVRSLNISINNKKLVDNINFTIKKGQVLTIVGESGSGKTLSALAILNLLKYRGNFKVDGEVIFENGRLGKVQNLSKLSDSEMREIRGQDIAMIFQDPMTSLNPLHKIGQQLIESMKLHNANISKKEMQDKIANIFHLVGLNDLYQRLDAYPHELSGGQKQRVMIAMALLNEPQLLIADEPTTALDEEIQQEIITLLNTIKREKNLAIIFVTHDLSIAKNFSDDVIVMREGLIIEYNSSDEIFRNPQHEYTRLLFDSFYDISSKTYNPESFEEVFSTKNLNIKYNISGNFSLFNRRYCHVVKDACLNIGRGETIGLIGKSGSGKSSFIKASLKLIESEGSIKLLGQEVADMTEKDFKPYRKKIQIVFQDPYSSLNPRMTVEQIIEEGLLSQFENLTKKERQHKILNALQQVNLPADFSERYPHELSGGQRQRVSIARSLTMQPDIIFFDEPTSALDVVNQRNILKTLFEIQAKQNISYIFISHDMRVIRAVSDRIYKIEDGFLRF